MAAKRARREAKHDNPDWVLLHLKRDEECQERNKVLREEGNVTEERSKKEGNTGKTRTGSKLKGEWRESGRAR